MAQGRRPDADDAGDDGVAELDVGCGSGNWRRKHEAQRRETEAPQPVAVAQAPGRSEADEDGIHGVVELDAGCGSGNRRVMRIRETGLGPRSRFHARKGF